MKKISWNELSELETYDWKLYRLNERWDDLTAEEQKLRLLKYREYLMERADDVKQTILRMEN